MKNIQHSFLNVICTESGKVIGEVSSKETKFAQEEELKGYIVNEVVVWT